MIWYDLQQLTLTEEVNPEQKHCEQEWSASLGPPESDAEESIWNSINILTVENRTESDGESYGESESTSDYEPPSDSDNSEDLQQLTLTEEEVNPEQQHCEQEWSASLGPPESDAEESIWNSINITVENRTESDGESYGESESTSDYEPPSDSDNSESDNVVYECMGKIGTVKRDHTCVTYVDKVLS
ncbi:hypothetical protein J4Q44_G00299000 [Coregonus suidteri]|uniref:Uncharacterized protein n=1 Tax=Coregonus suidteri TaxID=861788 RepID=A0AAN8KW19_9TELE